MSLLSCIATRVPTFSQQCDEKDLPMTTSAPISSVEECCVEQFVKINLDAAEYFCHLLDDVMRRKRSAAEGIEIAGSYTAGLAEKMRSSVSSALLLTPLMSLCQEVCDAMRSCLS